MKTFLILLFIFVLSFAQFKTKNSITKPQIETDAQTSALNFEPIFIKLTSFGNSRLVSSFLWSATLLFSDETHLTKDEKFSWMYYRFKNISELEPYFYENYLWGGQYLSVIKDDIDGAILHLNKGITYYPKSPDLNFYLGYNYLFEIEDFKLASKYLKAAYENGHPYKILPTLISKIDFNNGLSNENSYLLPYEAYQKEKNQIFKDRYYQAAYQIKAEFDLNCLNLPIKSNCNLVDLDGRLYIKSKNSWISEKHFISALRLKRK